MRYNFTCCSFAILIVCASTTIAFPRGGGGNYTRLRNEILEYERRLMIGANLSLSDVERAANKILMKAKQEELHAGFKDPRLFAPARNFLEAKNDIDGSKVFQLIRHMPKGAVLHSHDTALVSSDYIYYNVTFRNDLYACIEKDTVELRFFRVPDNSCSWELLKDIRRDPTRGEIVNDMIRKRMSMRCDDPTSSYPNVDRAWHKFIDIFAFVGPLLTYRPVYEDYFLEALNQLYEDNVMYLELRSTLPTLYDFDATTKYKPRDLVGIYRNLTRRFKEMHPDFVGAKLIYAPRRSDTYEDTRDHVRIMSEIKELYPDFVAGFDLVGQEDKGHTLEEFADLLREVGKRNISFFFHAGETNWLGAPTDENLVDAILLNTRRIGHGYALASHPFLMELVKRMDIAIEVNPISNQVLKLVDDLRNHAARSLFAEGYAVVVSNDDPSFWGARALSYDFYEAFMALMSSHADLKSLKQLALNSFIYSSLGDDEKQKAIDRWQGKWQKYVEDLAVGRK
ncbi:adenosine deaminase 2-like [Ceratina calcarata]|uniref:Adenosine deaminase n=1 Tax=Ceratina calcarata TaxID=156304 RepID=A0AAJ7S6I9_9HYME|nr:adenosine deaminase 2-like [Ceratina calcarata]